MKLEWRQKFRVNAVFLKRGSTPIQRGTSIPTPPPYTPIKLDKKCHIFQYHFFCHTIQCPLISLVNSFFSCLLLLFFLSYSPFYFFFLSFFLNSAFVSFLGKQELPLTKMNLGYKINIGTDSFWTRELFNLLCYYNFCYCVCYQLQKWEGISSIRARHDNYK